MPIYEADPTMDAEIPETLLRQVETLKGLTDNT